MKTAVRYGDQSAPTRVKMGEGLVGYAAQHKEPVLVSDVSADPPLHQARRRHPLRAGDPADDQRSLHRRVRPREPGPRRVQEERRPDPHASGQPGGRGDRERTLVRDDQLERNPAGEGTPVRAARAGCAAADGPAQTHQGRGRGRQIRTGVRVGRRLLRFPRTGTAQSRDRRGRRVRQGRARGALQRVCRGVGAVTNVPPAIHLRSIQPGRCARVDEHDPARAAARAVLLHAVLRAVRFQTPDRCPGQFRPAVSRCAAAARPPRRSSCRACRSDRSAVRCTTK